MVAKQWRPRTWPQVPPAPKPDEKPKPKRHGKPWTVIEDSYLRKEVARRVPFGAIADHHERTHGSVLARLRELGYVLIAVPKNSIYHSLSAKFDSHAPSNDDAGSPPGDLGTSDQPIDLAPLDSHKPHLRSV